jgi:hypothetical protein
VSKQQVSGVRFRVSGKINRKSETFWSEAEIPSEAKRQRETLKPETFTWRKSCLKRFDVHCFLRFFQLAKKNDGWIIVCRLTLYFAVAKKNLQKVLKKY